MGTRGGPPRARGLPQSATAVSRVGVPSELRGLPIFGWVGWHDRAASVSDGGAPDRKCHPAQHSPTDPKLMACADRVRAAATADQVEQRETTGAPAGSIRVIRPNSEGFSADRESSSEGPGCRTLPRRTIHQRRLGRYWRELVPSPKLRSGWQTRHSGQDRPTWKPAALRTGPVYHVARFTRKMHPDQAFRRRIRACFT